MSARSRMRRLAGTLAGIAVASAIFFATGEALSRTFHLVDRLNHFPRRLFVASDDPSLPYVMRPGVDADVRGFRVRVNALGLRGPAVAPAPAPGVHRILALGDSTTFGEGLPVEHAFPARLEEMLNRRGETRWEVVNAGVQGYNTAAELAYLERHGLALAPATVIVGFNLNDYDHAPVLGPLGVLTADRTQRLSSASLANRSEFLLVLRWLGRAVAGWLAGRPGSPSAEDVRGFGPLDRYGSALRKAYYRQPTDERWSVLEASLAGLGRLVRAEGVRLVVAIIPDGDQIGVAEPDLTPQAKLMAIYRREGLECLDLVPDFAAEAASGPLFLDIMHPNAAGQEIIARRLAAHLAPGGAPSPTPPSRSP